MDGVGATLFYLLVYALATTGAFAVLAYLSSEHRQIDGVDELAGIGRTHPISAAAARSDVPAAIFLRATATCSSLYCCSNNPMPRVYSLERRSTHPTHQSAVNGEVFDSVRRDVRRFYCLRSILGKRTPYLKKSLAPGRTVRRSVDEVGGCPHKLDRVATGPMVRRGRRFESVRGL